MLEPRIVALDTPLAETPPAEAPVPTESNVDTRVEGFTQNADLSWVVELFRSRRDEILTRWLQAAQDQPFHQEHTKRAVTDHIPALFDALGALLSKYSHASANPGTPLEDTAVLEAARQHAQMRLKQGFLAPDIATEFRLLRQEIGRALRLYVSEISPVSDVVGAELLLHDTLDGAVFIALTALTDQQEELAQASAALRLSETRFLTLVESVEDYAIFTLDAQGAIATWNEGAQRIFGYDPDQISFAPFATLFTPQDVAADVPRCLLVEAVEKGRVNAAGERLRADFTLLQTEATVTALSENENVLGFVVIMHDVSARIKFEQERTALSETLSHDLKSPLVSALALTQLLLYRSRKNTVAPEMLAEHLSTLEAVLRRGALRVDELMDISRSSALSSSAEPGTACEPAELDLRALVSEVFSRYRLTHPQRDFALELSEEDIHGAWDTDLIERSIDNLMNNAVKFSPPTSAIHGQLSLVGATNVPEDGSEGEVPVAVFTLSDSGPGIPREEQERIFERFNRGSNVKDVPGSGVGLWSVRRIIAGYGGTVAVESSSSAGTTFVLRLPLPQPATEKS